MTNTPTLPAPAPATAEGLRGEHWIGSDSPGPESPGPESPGPESPGPESPGPESHRAATADEGYRAVVASTGEPLEPRYVDATPEEIDRALQLAAEAHRQWLDRPREDRARLLEAIAEEIEALGDALIERAHLETALPVARLQGERGRTVAQLRFFAEHLREGSWLDATIDTALPDREPLPRPDLRRIQRPLGPVVVFGASNFPLAFSVAGGDTASALAAGCPVVVKAHPHHPGTSEWTAHAIRRAVERTNAPDGVFSLVHGRSHRVGGELVEHPNTAAVGFTGSLAGGKALFDLANQRPKPIPVFAEMGSVNPVVLLPGALGDETEKLAQGFAASVTLGAGQFCTNPGLIFALESDLTKNFEDHLAAALDQAQAGTLLYGGLRDGYRDGTERIRQTDGVSCGTGRPALASDRQVHPMLFRTNVRTFLEQPGLTHEVFGPSTILVLCRDLDEIRQAVHALDGQLTATVHGTAADLEACDALIRDLEERVGRLIFGGYPTGVEVGHAMCHGGPFPATTAVNSTSVGSAAIRRFTRPLCYQDAPSDRLPLELRDENPDGILRRVNGTWTRDPLS